MKNAIHWFEIPATDLDRAARFYERVLGSTLQRETFAGQDLAIFRCNGEKDGVAGAVVADPKRKPAAQGTCVYLDARGDLDGALVRAKQAGGEVLVPRTDIGAPGFIALIRDSEGNTVGLHSERT